MTRLALPGVARQPSPHRRTLVGTQVVQDQVQRLVRWCVAFESPQELHEFLTPVAPAAFADHDPVQDAQCRIQCGRPVTDVVMGLAFGDAGPQRQHWAHPVQRLDPALLIDTEHHGFGGWIQIQPHHVAELLDKVGVGRQLEPPHPMGLESVLSPNLANRAVAHALRLRQGATAPVRAGRVDTGWVADGLSRAAGHRSWLHGDPREDLGAAPFQFTQRVRPAEPGYSVGHPQVTAGTFGLAVKWGPTDDWWVLSNNHVLANSNGAAPGDFIRQPGTHDGGTTADRIAHLEAFATINFEGASGKKNVQDLAAAAAVPRAVARAWWATFRGTANVGAWLTRCPFRLELRARGLTQPTPNLVDVAIAKPLNQRLISTVIGDIGQPREIQQVGLGTLTTKKGRTTEITRLICDGVDGTIRVQYGGGRLAAFHHQDLYRAEDGGEGSAGGDSGSAIVSRDGAIWYSLLFAGGGGLTVGNRALDCAARPRRVVGGHTIALRGMS